MYVYVSSKPEHHQNASAKTKQVLMHSQGRIPLILFLAQYLPSFFTFEIPWCVKQNKNKN